MYDTVLGCPTEELAGKWKLELLLRLSEGGARWSTLIHSIPQAAPNVLTRQLRSLEESGQVRRIITSAQPPQVVAYTLSEKGQQLVPLLRALRGWSVREEPETAGGLSTCQRVISSRWMLPILFAVCEPVRFGDIQKTLGGVARGVLAVQLQALRDMGLICQKRYEGFPPRVEYVLSPKGRDLLKILTRQEAG